MYEQEKHRLTHLTILLCYTILTIALAAESIVMGWDMGAMVLLILALIGSWIVHITERLPGNIRMWLYYILSMLAFFYYGIHETSLFDLAPVMVVVMLIYTVTEMDSVINCCMITYYATICYDFIFVMEHHSQQWDSLKITRLLLHLTLVFMAGQMSKLLFHRRNKEKKLSDAKIAELEEINHRTEYFLTNVSHELRTPINAVTGITSVMMKNEQDEGKRKDIMAIQSAGHRLFQQIEDILDYTEIDTGRIVVSEEPYMISSLVNDLLAEMQLRKMEGGPELVLDVDARMPAMLLGDGRKIKKIIKHLIDNSIKYTRNGGIHVRVYAIRKSYGINLCIKVRDTGIGVGEEQLKKITQRFYQSSSSREHRSGGLGLGLSIVYGLTTAMDGFIQIESAEGNGTTVSVSIPQRVSDAEPCMVVEGKEDLCMACFLRPEKYESPEVRDYYGEAITHMVHELGVTLHRLNTVEELKKMVAVYRLTHLFIGREEYEECADYIEGLDRSITVAVFADADFVIPEGSHVKVVRKPFYCLSLVNILNARVSEEEEFLQETRMYCPGVRVLVVDDEPMNLMVAEGIFKGYQMQVATAGSGHRAIELCQEQDYDLIFLDHMMPEMDGVETLKLLRKIPRQSGDNLTVVAFTANAVSGAREMFRREGFDDFVSKPVEDLELERVLRRVLPKSLIIYANEQESKVLFGSAGVSADAAAGIGELTDTIRLERLKVVGIQVQIGLNYSRGDVSFYLELITAFIQEAESKSMELEQYSKAEDYANYQIRVHALKSSAKLIGAIDFSEKSRKMEEAAKNLDAGYLQVHHDDLLQEYRLLTEQMREALGLHAEKEEYTHDNTVEITKKDFLMLLKNLKGGLDTFEIDKAEEVLTRCKDVTYQGDYLEELLKAVAQDVDNFECAAASQKVATLIAEMEGGEA